MQRHTVTVEIDVPEGFEPTGEFRKPVKGEYYLSLLTSKRTILCSSYELNRKVFILKKTPPREYDIFVLPNGQVAPIQENVGVVEKVRVQEIRREN